MKQTIFVFSGIAIAISLIYQLNQFLLLGNWGTRNFSLFISALFFILIGIVLQRLLAPTKTQSVEKETDPQMAIEKSGLSKQEYKVLTLLAEGMSNSEIGEVLFIEESTVKSHVSKVLLKLNARRRTEAVKIGRDMQILS